MKTKSNKNPSSFEKMSTTVTKASGSTPTFVIAFLIIIAWLVSGPFFDFSNTWQLVINTGTTIITFLMVFLIQRAQNKDSVAIHVKLNELLAVNELASNRLVTIEDIGEEELKVIQKYYKHLAAMSKKDMSLFESHSIDEANVQHEQKRKATKVRKKP